MDFRGKMNVWYSGFSIDNTENEYVVFLFFYNWFLAALFLWEDKGSYKKIKKTFGLWFVFLWSQTFWSDWWFFLFVCLGFFWLGFFFLSTLYLLIFFSPICVLSYGKGWRQHCKLYHKLPIYGPMHLHGVCMNGSLSNWHTMLHYTSQWGSMQVR